MRAHLLRRLDITAKNNSLDGIRFYCVFNKRKRYEQNTVQLEAQNDWIFFY